MQKTRALLNTLNESPDSVEFDQVMAVIDAEYHHSPTAFVNGSQINSAEQNQGSCKILSFARLNGLSDSQTLHCFGRYYREDVLNHPQGEDHGNIRAFMKTGWAGVVIDSSALVEK